MAESPGTDSFHDHIRSQTPQPLARELLNTKRNPVLRFKNVIKVMLVGEEPDRAASVRGAMHARDYDVVTTLISPLELYARVAEHQPDVIIIDTESPSRDVLEHIAFISRDQPRPIVMFSDDRASETIRQAVRAGVTAYIVDGLAASRVEPILSVAVE
jgi:response regulator NasT